MSARITIATATRVLTQLRRDPRTIALLLVVPAALVTLIKFVFDNSPGAFDGIGGPLVGLFPFITMFLVTSITMLRERTTGNLERLMTMPLAKLDILPGSRRFSSCPPSFPPAAALRPVRCPRPDGRGAGSGLVCAPPDLCLRRARPPTTATSGKRSRTARSVTSG